MKNAIVVVSFGTSHEDTRKKTIDAIEERVAREYRDYKVFGAYSSNFIIRKLKQVNNRVVLTVNEVFQHLVKQGYTEVIVQPIHVIQGKEYDLMLDDIHRYVSKFDMVRVGLPLLTSSRDCKELIDAIIREYPLEEKEAMVLMGHGSEHSKNSAYHTVNNICQTEGHTHIYVATMAGLPTLEEVVQLIKKEDYDKVKLIPFMIVAGVHVRNDMAGNKADSWKSILSKEGYEVTCITKGLGELVAVKDIVIRHIEEAKEL